MTSKVIGLAAWWHGWDETDFDKIAGSLLAGHLIECGCYVASSTTQSTAIKGRYGTITDMQ